MAAATLLALDVHISDERHAEIRAEIRAARAAANPATETDAERCRRQRADRAARDQAELEDVLRRFLPLLTPGRHDLPEVWSTWVDSSRRSEGIRAKHPRVLRVGRTKFYEALAAVTTVHTGHAGARWILVEPAAAQAA